jgi:GST-like protein
MRIRTCARLAMIELYGDATGNCIRVAIALAESGLAHRIRKVDLAGGAQRGPDYLALNPLGRVPTIVDDDGPGHARFVLTQSNAILHYVAEKSGRLLPSSGHARGVALEWLFAFVTDVIAPNFQSFQLVRALGREQSAAAVQVLGRRAMAMYEPLDRQLSRHAFVAGPELSIADIAGHVITQALRDALPWEALANVRRWFEALEQRPSFRYGHAVFR